MAKLFEIPITSGGQASSFDVTPFIVLNTYAVSSQPVYEDWEDGYCHARRAVRRRKLQGSFDVKFFNQKDYQDFLSTVESARVTGFDYIVANVYDNKSRTVHSTVNIYFDYEPANLEPSVGYSFNEEFSIDVEEV